MIHTLFFELLQVAVGNRTRLSRIPSAEEWEEIYEISKQHTLVGIVFAGIEQLPQEQLPPPRRIRQWAVKADRLRDKNMHVSKLTAAVWRYFHDNGFNCMILKGQGNAVNYPEHLRNLRTPGDIDVWAWPFYNENENNVQRKNKTFKIDKTKKSYGNENENRNGDVRTVVEFCLSKKKGEYVYYHNLDFPILKDIPVEVHYRPSWLYTPWRNRRLQRWFVEYKKDCKTVEYGGYRIPNCEFNIIFQLLHLYKHIFEEGIGLRQLLDYYYVLRAENLSSHSSLISSLGLNRFAAAVMYVLQQVFDPEHTDWMLCPPDERRGRLLLSEIMRSGNFGQHDDRYNWANVTNGSMRYRGLPYAIARIRHNIRFLFDYPLEVMFEPLFRIYNKMWLLLRLWRYE